MENKQVPISFKEMRRIASMPIKAFAAFGKKYDTVDGVYFFKNNNAKILFVAHLDSVQNFTHFSDLKLRSAHRIYFPTVDDRLGAWLGLCHLPKYGCQYDILLTEGEEKGQSTAQWFATKKKYNWIFSFDRMGTDVVLYQYRSSELVTELQKYGFTVGMGSFSDISVLDDLGCKGINFGTAYYNYHSPEAYFVKGELLTQVQKFLRFYAANHDTYLPHESKQIWKALSTKGRGPNKGAYKSSYPSSETRKATPAGTFGPVKSVVENKAWEAGMGISKAKSSEHGSPLEYLTVTDIDFLKGWNVPEGWYKGSSAILQHSDIVRAREIILKRLETQGLNVSWEDVHYALTARYRDDKKIAEERFYSDYHPDDDIQKNWRYTPTLAEMYFDRWKFEEHITLRMTTLQKQVLMKFGINHSKRNGFVDKVYLESVAKCLLNNLINIKGEPTEDSPYVRTLVEGAFGRKEKIINVTDNKQVTEVIDNCIQCHKAFPVKIDNPETLCSNCQKSNQSQSNQKKKLRIVGGLQIEITKAEKYDYRKDPNGGEFKWFSSEPGKTEPTTTISNQQNTSQFVE